MQTAYYYIVVDILGQRLFLNQDGDLTDRFDQVWRFPDRGTARAYLTTHPFRRGRTDIIGMG